MIVCVFLYSLTSPNYDVRYAFLVYAFVQFESLNSCIKFVDDPNPPVYTDPETKNPFHLRCYLAQAFNRLVLSQVPSSFQPESLHEKLNSLVKVYFISFSVLFPFRYLLLLPHPHSHTYFSLSF